MGRVKSAKQKRKLDRASNNANNFNNLTEISPASAPPQPSMMSIQQLIYNDPTFGKEVKLMFVFLDKMVVIPEDSPSSAILEIRRQAVQLYFVALEKFAIDLHGRTHSDNLIVHTSNNFYIRQLLETSGLKENLQALLNEENEEEVAMKLSDFKLKLASTLEELTKFHEVHEGNLMIPLRR